MLEEKRKKACERSKKFYQEHKEEIALYYKEYRKTHRKQLTENQRRYYYRNREKILAKMREKANNK